jgi:hypothetical protein
MPAWNEKKRLQKLGVRRSVAPQRGMDAPADSSQVACRGVVRRSELGAGSRSERCTSGSTPSMRVRGK